MNQVEEHNIFFSFTMPILLKYTEVYFKSIVDMKPVPDWLLILLVLFTVDYFYPIFPGSRTPWETADEWDTMHDVDTNYTYISTYVKLLSASPHLQFTSLLLCTFCVKRNCQWYVQNHHSLVLGTWIKKIKMDQIIILHTHKQTLTNIVPPLITTPLICLYSSEHDCFLLWMHHNNIDLTLWVEWAQQKTIHMFESSHSLLELLRVVGQHTSNAFIS